MKTKKYNRQNKSSRDKDYKRLATIAIVAVSLLALGSLAFYRHTFLNNSRQPENITEANGLEGKINFEPPTEEELQATEAHKDSLAQQNPPPPQPNPSTGKISVKPIITIAEQYESNVEVSSYVGEVFEEGGVCKLRLTRNGATVERTTTGIKDVSKTVCPTFSVPVSELGKGNWNASMIYESGTAQGTSDSKTIKVE